MNRRLKIAIFSGTIPSATFIERVIEGVSITHEVYLFGVDEGKVTYPSNNVSFYLTPKRHLDNLFITTLRLVKLLFKSPKDVLPLLDEVKQYSKLYDRWIWFSKFLPIVLYRPDIFHIQWARDIGFYYFLKERFGCKLVVSLLGSHINYSPIVDTHLASQYYSLFPKVDRFHAVSDAISIEAQKYGALPSAVQVIHSPVTLNTFKAFKLKTKSRQLPFRVLSVGRHHWVKGYKYALDAIAKVKEWNLKVEYTIIAQGVIPESLLFQRDQCKLKDEVSFVKGMKQEVLFETMKQYDVLVLPSLNEGIANVVLEAMALGIPVISTDCGGMPELVIPNETGWLVPVRDAEALAEAIVEVMQTSEQELQRIAKNAHDFVKQQFSAEDSIEKFLKLYGAVFSR